MNTSSRRILIGSLVTFLIIIAGLGVGFFFSSHKIVSTEEKQVTADNAEPNFNTYDISPPNRATSIETKDVTLRSLGTAAFVIMPKNEAANVKTGQRVLLYTPTDELIETLGEVTAVNPGSEDLADFVTVHIKYKVDEMVNAANAARGRIVINRIPDSARLPLSALVKNDNGEAYAWEAIENDDGTFTARYARINVVATTYEYFVIKPESHRTGFFVLNPDTKLANGQKINVRQIRYSTPAETDDDRIALLMDTRRRELDTKRAAFAAAQQETPGGGLPSADGGGGSCGTSFTTARDFMTSVDRLAPTLPQQSTPAAP